MANVACLEFFIGEMQQRAHVGVNRAAAFLGMSQHYLEMEFPASLTLGSPFKKQIVPDPIPEDAIPEIKENYRNWVISSALRDLDQFFSLFLDDCYIAAQNCTIIAEKRRKYSYRSTSKETNSAKKYKLVLSEVNRFDEAAAEHYRHLRSLSNLRNCLAHDLGFVTESRASEGRLTASWLKMEFVAEVDGKVFLLHENPGPFDKEAQVSLRFSEHVIARDLGERVDLTPDELLDLCFFYKIVIDDVALKIQATAEKLGVKFPKLP